MVSGDKGIMCMDGIPSAPFRDGGSSGGGSHGVDVDVEAALRCPTNVANAELSRSADMLDTTSRANSEKHLRPAE